MIKKILKILNSDEKIAKYAGLLLRLGAGTIFPGDMRGNTKPKIAGNEKQLIAWELSETLSAPIDGEWETEIGRLVLTGNVGRMREMLLDTYNSNPQCPHCRYGSRIRYRQRDQKYICTHCNNTWDFN